ncbi:MAG: glycerophosphodiester phosphodiesterase family protein [Bacteroidales bacterium]|nr:glycerophosphodiester phosphodiesterase family protein [Bacteroidales bacterium]
MKRLSHLLLLLFVAFLLPAYGQQGSTSMSIEQRVTAVLHNPDYVAVVSHRGDWRNWPENSIPAIESAIKMGVDMVEIDVKMTRDGVLVLCHDWTIDRTTTGSGAVSDYTYEQLMAYDLKRGHGIAIPGLKIPTLRQALEVCKGRVLVNVDHGFDYYDQVLALTEELGVTGQVVIKSGRPRAEVDSIMNRHTVRMIYMPVLSISESTDMTLFKGYLEQAPVAFELCFNTLNDRVKMAASQVTAAGSKVWVNTLWGSLCGNHDDDRAYTASDPDEVYGPILELGTNIIQTDRPEFLINYLEKKGRR